MKKLTPEQIDKEAQRIKEEYAYMDNMPLEGWMWEFIRRSQKYKQRYETLKTIWDENISLKPVLYLHGAKADNTVLEIHPSRQFNLIIHGIQKQMGISLQIKEGGLIKPSVKYSELREDVKPAIELKQVGYMNFEDLLDLLKSTTNMLNEQTTGMEERGKGYERYREKTIKMYLLFALGRLAPQSPSDAIYIAISKKGKKEEIKKQLNEIVDKHVKRYTSKTNKGGIWKFYIITYDLKENFDFEYSTIAKIFDKAFPKTNERKYPKTEVERYHTEAIKYTEKGKYKEYLLV